MSYNPEIARLVEARQKVWGEIRSLSDRAAEEGRDFSVDEEATWAKGNAEIDALDERLSRVVDLEKRDADVEATLAKYGSGEAPKADAVRTDNDILRAIGSKDASTRSHDFAPTSWESRGTATLVAGTAGVGGNTVPTSFYDTLIESMLEVSSVLTAGATVLTTTGGEALQVPTATAHPVAALIGENAQITTADATFGQKTLNAYKYAFVTKVSSELLSDSAVNLVDYLGRRGGEALGNACGTASISGTGSSQPQGIIASSGGLSSTASASGSAAAGFLYNDVLTLVHAITRPYRTNASFICNDAVVLQLRKLRDLSGGAGTGQYLWQPSTQAGEPDRLAGYPVYTDPAMPSLTTNGLKGLAFGDWSKAVMVRFAGPVRVESSTDFAFDYDLTTWRFIVRFDSEIVDAGAARVLTYTT